MAAAPFYHPRRVINPTWLYTLAVYALAIFALRRGGNDIPIRVATWFYALVLIFMFQPLTQSFVNLPVDFLKTLPPWAYVTNDHTSLNRDMNDIVLQIVPWAHQVRTAWRSFTPPLWNNMSACGYPLLGSGQSSALSILRILGLPLTLAHAMTFEAAMKILIALTFMFLWCRKRGYSELASTVGATAFGFSTFIIVWLHFPLITTACFVPAVFYLIDLIVERPTRARFAAAAIVWAVMLFGGHPETVSHTFFVALLYVSWIVFIERSASWRVFLTLGAALAVAGLLAAPFLAPFAETVRKSKRFQELKAEPLRVEVPFSDWSSAVASLQPHFFGDVPHEQAWGPAHPEAMTAFAGYLGVAAWFALLVHVVARRRFRSREAFFVIATVIVLGVIMSWPGISQLFHIVFRLAANARLRLFLALLLSIQTAAAIDLMKRDRPSLLAGILSASALLLYVLRSFHYPHDFQRDSALLAALPSMLVLLLAAVCAMIERRRDFAIMLLLVAVVAELWTVSRDWNPVVDEKWMYPQTPLLKKLARLQAEAKEPFRITANGPAFFPNLPAVYGFEDVRAHDPMTNGKYVGLLQLITNYDARNYFAPWEEYNNHFIDFLNVRYVVTTRAGELPPRYRKLYDDRDGSIFENTTVLPRFFAVQRLLMEFRDPYYFNALKTLDDWSRTAILDKLDIENPQMRHDLLDPRPPDAPMATVEILEEKAGEYRLHIVAPRYTLIASSVPWWPGWKVQRNGALTTPIKVNGGFLGFAVPAGELDVRVWYDPWTFRAGWIVSLATIVGLIVVPTRKR